MKHVYRFRAGQADGRKEMKEILGGKGANLAEMCALGLPVPPGFTISTLACAHYMKNGKAWPAGLDEEVKGGVRHLEEATGLRFGDPERPLLVSVRSGAAASMPGMMDTVLNLGMNDAVAEGLARRTGNRRLAFDSYRRLIDMFGDVVIGVHHDHFEAALHQLKTERNKARDIDLGTEDLEELVRRYKAVFKTHTGKDFPSDPNEQLRRAIDAVFESWNTERAVKYRQIHRITGLLGTAVNVQAMVFGNGGKNSGTGVCFTRNPATGKKELYGEFLVDAQGEDVVAGIRTPEPIAEMSKHLPGAYHELVAICDRLERHMKNMQDVEFTVEDGKLMILQTRNGKRTGLAAIRVALELVDEGLVDRAAAVRDLVEPEHVDQLLHPGFTTDRGEKNQIIAKGLAASTGAAVGQAVFNAADAEAMHAAGAKVILVRRETSPEDVGGMRAAEGILTSRGGITSHAAVVARGWGKPCVCGTSSIVVDEKGKSFTNGKITVKEGEFISIDGATGEVFLGKRELSGPAISGEFAKFMTWVDEFRTTGVRANADTPEDARRAVELGAEGIGLCRTEHMFFNEQRILHMREMIIADNEKDRRAALDKLFPYQLEDFRGIFRAMGSRPVTIRLLDPPLHEFLPETEHDQTVVARDLGVAKERVRQVVLGLHEANPMLGHRGCRLGLTYPEITEMQTRAIVTAAIHVRREGHAVKPEIMVPLVADVRELADQRAVIVRTAEKVFAEQGERIDYKVGTMIELPRAALLASEIAAEADFFSFGTNDLTQTTFGLSRDDAGKFLPEYVGRMILPSDPFQSIDVHGVGQLVKLGTERGRATKSDLKVGVCGEHGGDPQSVEFFADVGLDYVSCSPFRIPVARLAAARHRLKKAKAHT